MFFLLLYEHKLEIESIRGGDQNKKAAHSKNSLTLFLDVPVLCMRGQRSQALSIPCMNPPENLSMWFRSEFNERDLNIP